MPVCGYVVVPQPNAKLAAAAELTELDGCSVFPAEQGDLLLLVTSTDSLEADADLRRRVEQIEAVQALLLTFGEVDPEIAVGDPLRRSRRERGAGAHAREVRS